MKLDEFETNAELESKGVKRRFEDITFTIAAANNPRHQRRMAALVKQHSAHKVQADVALQQALATEAMADTILLDWEGEISHKGRVLNPKDRADRLTVLGMRTVREWIAGESTNVANFQNSEDAAEVDALKSSAEVEP